MDQIQQNPHAQEAGIVYESVIYMTRNSSKNDRTQIYPHQKNKTVPLLSQILLHYLI